MSRVDSKARPVRFMDILQRRDKIKNASPDQNLYAGGGQLRTYTNISVQFRPLSVSHLHYCAISIVSKILPYLCKEGAKHIFLSQRISRDK
jgi:hypothetical protein